MTPVQVDLRTHQGFLGGLVPIKDNTSSDPLAGNTAYFYADRNYEIIFHEVVRMPTDPKDPHQLEKVRSNTIVLAEFLTLCAEEAHR